MKKKRIWLVQLLRLPESAEQQISNLIQKIPEKLRFWINFAFLIIALAYLVSKKSVGFSSELKTFTGLIIAIGVIFFALYKACARARNIRLTVKTAFWVASAAILLQMLLMRAGEFIAIVFLRNSELLPFQGYLGFELAIPFTVAALIISILIGSQLALISSFIVSLFVAIMPDGGMALALYSLTGSIAAISGVERYRTRNAISVGIVVIGIANMLMGVVIPLIVPQPMSWRLSLTSAALGILSALQATAITSLSAPLFESAFGILTEMKLLELSNADNPLLRELAIKTPGTNHHSFIVAELAEAAAKAIGANALLTKTACLYHDIGKMAAPRMYIENQNGIDNPHNKVEPRDSVRIVTGHVRRGIKMGLEAGLPQQIVDFIPQHHGTRILAYFYHKAKSQAAAAGNEEAVNPDDFRYPGPKPQTKEAVIVMLADGAEAAVRSLHERTEENIRAILKKIIDHIVADGQFDESDVTLQELNTIRESLVNTLRSIHHERVSYPGFNPPAPGDPQYQAAKNNEPAAPDDPNSHPKTDGTAHYSAPRE